LNVTGLPPTPHRMASNGFAMWMRAA